ncbi:MAG: Asp-tRNA(Asn)/Glu-tRNA(Gln) amidotransferase subunit GatB [Candidatus Omnitrophica bacterium]|nr:Asp-tRNA(Asn)/Glu-tRNA(Gln) amidotransferase subunit GatB [Candidatus Omnitrophota bacterium]
MREERYEAVMGLEVHVQLSTKSKIFCGCSTKFGAEANTKTCPVCLGLPGALPVLNREVLHRAIKVGLALDCRTAKMMKFDRKNYFYPDLPKDFQISQYDLPLAANGRLGILTDGKERTVRIKRVHLEEDAGKLIHMEDEDASLVDFNRTGMPLLEIVSEPDISSPEEAYDYLTQLKTILKYLEVSDCNMEEGSLRCDANISIRPKGQVELGVKTELKNMNTFKGVKNALQYEIKRQGEVLDEGGTIKQETRLWDEAKGRTSPMRTKEEAFDYRYFPEPDLVPFIIDKELVESIRKGLPELPRRRLERFIEDYKLPPAAASLLVNEKEVADYFEDAAGIYKKDAKVVANWITGDIQGELNKRSLSIKELGIKPNDLADMIKMIDEGSITGKIAKGLLADMVETKMNPRKIVESKGLLQIKDKGELDKILYEVIKANPKPVIDYKNGKVNVLTFLVGQVMKATKGKANPKMVNDLLRERMDKL